MIEWHPTAENILISSGADHVVLVWNTCKGRVVRVISCHPDTIQSISLNRDGSLLATTCKDKLLRIIDIRKQTVVTSGLCHEGPKSSKVTFLGDSGRLFTTGFSKFSDRQWAVWSQSDLSSPLRLENIDSSSGILFPFYDHDTQYVLALSIPMIDTNNSLFIPMIDTNNLFFIPIIDKNNFQQNGLRRREG